MGNASTHLPALAASFSGQGDASTPSATSGGSGRGIRVPRLGIGGGRRGRGGGRGEGRGSGRSGPGTRRAGLHRAASQAQPIPRTTPRSKASVPQSVPLVARVQWGRLVARSLEDIIDAAEHSAGPNAAEHLHACLEALATLPRRVLADSGASKGRARRILARLTRVQSGLALDDEVEDESFPRNSNRLQRNRRVSADQKLAARIQRFLQGYSVTKGARALASEPLANRLASKNGRSPRKSNR